MGAWENVPRSALWVQEWNFFLRGDSAVEDAGPPPAKWLSQSSWNEVVFLDATMPGLQGIKDSLSTDGGWNEWGGSEAPQDRTLPSGACPPTPSPPVTFPSASDH